MPTSSFHTFCSSQRCFPVTLSWFPLRHSLGLSLADICSKRLFSNQQIWSGHAVTVSHCMILSWISCLHHYFNSSSQSWLSETMDCICSFILWNVWNLNVAWCHWLFKPFLLSVEQKNSLSKAMRVIQKLRLFNAQLWHQMTAILGHNLNDITFYFC